MAQCGDEFMSGWADAGMRVEIDAMTAEGGQEIGGRRQKTGDARWRTPTTGVGAKQGAAR